MSPKKKSSPSKTAGPGRKKRSAAKHPDTAARRSEHMDEQEPQQIDEPQIDAAEAEAREQVEVEEDVRAIREESVPLINLPTLPPGLSPNQKVEYVSHKGKFPVRY